ncbi:MAG: wax ester/triacylglycerol synthase domain-containing protein, partial [Rhodococcus sp. (in: high G+C Gram-positive bacteria)]|uniref:wax ester/triacylglycerol synthase domain-containing protein n=1 Tax=Rhodococcus sp. TaxID=1831 RepID=UPI003BAE54F2
MVPLDPISAVLMTAEVVANPLHVAAVLILSPPEGSGDGYVDELYENALAGTDEVDARLRRYPHLGVDTGGVWVWRDIGDLDLRHHMRRRSLPPGAGREALWAVVGELHAEPLDRSRPMWQACLIDGLQDGKFAYYAKVHHSLMDGVAGFRMIAESLTSDPERRAMRPFFVSPPEKEPIGRAEAGSGILPNPIALTRSALGVAASSAGFVRRVVEGAASNMVQGLTTSTTTLPFGAPRTRFNGRLGRGRSFAAQTWPKSRLRAVQNAAGVTGNDVVTAMVAGGLRYWLIEHGELPARSLVAICPVSVRGRNTDR